MMRRLRRLRVVDVAAWLETLLQDVLLTFRNLRREPAFAAIVIATLAIGIGANTAIFTLVNAILLTPLKVADGDRVVRFVGGPAGGVLNASTSLPIARLWLQQAGAFEEVSAHRLDLLNLTGATNPEQIPVARVTHAFFRVFRAPVLIGRTFSEEEDRPGAERVVVISHAFWVRRFASRPDIAGTSISLGSEPHVVIGVLGPDFDSEQFTDPPAAWVPLRLDPASRDVGGEFCFVSARLRPGATIASANAQLEAAAAEYMQSRPPGAMKAVFAVQPARDAMVGGIRESLLLLVVAVALVLLIACANAANLLLMRGTGRAREIAVRAAMGAPRTRIVRQLITESLVISGLGAVCGFVVGLVAIRVLLAAYPAANPTILANATSGIPRIGEQGAAIGIDWRVMAFAVAASVVAGIAAGVFPASHLSRVDLQHSLRRTGGGGEGGIKQRRVRAALVVVEIALALALVVGAGLLIRTSFKLRAVDPGFDSRNVLTMRMSVSGTPFERRDGIARLTRQALERVNALPGVTAASTTCCMPLETVWQLPFAIQGGSSGSGSRAMAGWTFVSPGYFEVFRIPILRGRDFNERDDATGPGVVIINQEMARRYWPTGDPLDDQLIIGRGVRPDYEADPIRRIIGIVGDIRDTGLTRTPRPAMYVPVSQVPDGVTLLNVRLLPIVWIARTSGSPHVLAKPIEDALQTISNGLPVARIRSMDDVVAESTARTRFDMLLMIVFAASALTLAAVGIFGLVGYSVEQRTREIGVRLAVGAGSRQIAAMILRQGMTLSAIGIAIGLIIAFAFARLLAGLLFGVSPRDTLTFMVVPVALGFVALCAVAVPALRASRCTPMDALRHE
jgi:putative ABC transport system permease protein